MKTKITLLILAALLIAAPAFSQTKVCSTTLATPITSTSSTLVNLAYNTCLVAGRGQGPSQSIVVDDELMYVRISVVPPGTTGVTLLTVQRGAAGTRTALHNTSATVWAGLSSYFSTSPVDSAGRAVVGACTAGNEVSLPVIVTNGGLYGGVGTYDCIGSQWVQTNRPGVPVLGGVYTVPAGAIVPTGTIFLTDTGTAAATSITVPNGWAPGMCLTIIPGGAFTTTNAGNIRIATTAVAGKALFECWDGSKWDPSY